MKIKRHGTMIVCAVFFLSIVTNLKATAPAPKKGSIDLKSLTAITFNNDGILFLADPLGTHVYAIETHDAATAADASSVLVEHIDEKVAALLGVQPSNARIVDMAVHPKSKEIYLAVTRKGSPAQSVLIKCDLKGDLRPIPLKNVSFYETSLNDVPDANVKLPQKWHTLSMAVTDMAFIDGELFVSGLSGEQFSSKMRRFKFPFDEGSQAVQLEIFHTSHDTYETHSPIETFLPFQINGQMQILAGYGCSPVAKFSLQDIRSNTKLRGVTLAELGGGNRPLDMIAYKKDGRDYVLIANSDRTMMRMSSEDLDNGKPLTTVVQGAYVNAGVNYLSIAEVGVMQLDDFNNKSFIVIQRNVHDGSLNLKTMEKWF